MDAVLYICENKLRNPCLINYPCNLEHKNSDIHSCAHLAPNGHNKVLLERLAAEAVLAFIHGGSHCPTLPNGSVPHPLLLTPLILLLCHTRHKHVIQRVVVTICLPHHLESRMQQK